MSDVSINHTSKNLRREKTKNSFFTRHTEFYERCVITFSDENSFVYDIHNSIRRESVTHLLFSAYLYNSQVRQRSSF